jgi:hypothetical protein
MFKALQRAWDFVFSPFASMVPRSQLVETQRLLEQSIQSNWDLLQKYNETGLYLDRVMEIVNDQIYGFIHELKKNPADNAKKIENLEALQESFSAQLRNFRVEVAKYQVSKR